MKLQYIADNNYSDMNFYILRPTIEKGHQHEHIYITTVTYVNQAAIITIQDSDNYIV